MKMNIRMVAVVVAIDDDCDNEDDCIIIIHISAESIDDKSIIITLKP